MLCECGVRVRRNAAERARALRRCALYFDAMRFTESVKVRFWTTCLLNTKERAFSTKPEYHPKAVSVWVNYPDTKLLLGASLKLNTTGIVQLAVHTYK